MFRFKAKISALESMSRGQKCSTISDIDIGWPLTLIREFLGPSPSAFSGKKNPELSLVTSQLGLEK